MSVVVLFIHAHITSCMCPQLHPHHPPWNTVVGSCEWGVDGVRWISHLSTEQHICCWSWWLTAALWKQTLCWDLGVGKHGCCCESSCHPPLLAFRWIIHIFTNSYELRVPPRFLLGSQFFLLSLHPSKSLAPSLPPSFSEQMHCYSSTLAPASPTRTLALRLSLSYILVRRENNWWEGIALF